MTRLVAASGALAFALSLAPSAAADQAPVDLQRLIDEAEPGEVITLDADTYEGGVVIDKVLTLRGEGWPVVDGRGNGHVIEITAPDVTVEGLVIRGSGDALDKEHAGVSGDAARIRVIGNRFEDVLFGIFLRRGDGSEIKDNVIGSKDLFIARRGDGIRLWESHSSTIENNVVDSGRDSVFWFCDDLIVRNNRVSNGRYGLHFMYTDGSLIEGNVTDGNSVGTFLMYSKGLTVTNNVFSENRGPSGYGLGLKDVDGAEATGNRFLGNRVGVFFDNSPSERDVVQHFESNVFAFNDIGALFQPSVEGNLFSENAFIDNGEQVATDGRGDLEGNEWSVDGRGNYWSDFAGYDADGNGLGDIPYEIEDVFSDLTDSYPDLMFFQGTPAARAVDMAGRAFPDLKPEPKLSDDAPLVEMPGFPAAPTAEAAASNWPVAVVSLALLGFAGGFIWLAGRRPGSGTDSKVLPA
ncbi:MAG: putative ABC transporter binding protein NosD [Acidimicrobiales bacterium]|nr:MAG: nitrous oxide reductase family maturation protein NosD [Actinomycetota bacterium]MBV6509465.1 putative ABC transporter binding protein NosD [Acidimicrobiales bacterium]RIK06779.1 MAG: nitrous oxide reductase family maturation protein NosD [Acidobacteriota bacterium]